MEVICWTAPTVAANLAIDEAVARSAWAAGRHLLRFWWGGPPTVVMGSNERPEQVVDSAACARRGVDLLKRCTGGGTALQTCGVLNYSLVTPAPHHFDLKAGFRPGTDLICAILAAFGVSGVPQGTSDVAVGDRKISGSAQARRWKAMLVHGTLLVDFDFDLAEKVLHHPLREPAYRRGRSHREFLITLRALGARADRNAIERAAIEAARQVFGRVDTLPEAESPPGMIRAALALGSAAQLAEQKTGLTVAREVQTSWADLLSAQARVKAMQEPSCRRRKF